MSGPECAYCGCDVTAHDPISVREWGGEDSGGDADDGPDREGEIPFCNYGCLAAHVDDAGLALGATCSVEPSRR